LSQSLFCFELSANGVIDFDDYTIFGDKIVDKSKPLIRITFHSKCALKKRPLNFIINLFKINLEDYPLQPFIGATLGLSRAELQHHQ
jgi:hypothetical protein